MASASRFAGILAGVGLVEALLGRWSPAAAGFVDLFVLLVVLTALRGDSLRGLAAGLAAGLLQDTLTGSLYGLNSLACCVVGYGMARLSQQILTSHRTVAGLLIAVGVLVHQMIVRGLLVLLEIAEVQPGVAVPIGRAVVTTAVGLACLALAARVRRWWARRRTLRPSRVRIK